MSIPGDGFLSGVQKPEAALLSDLFPASDTVIQGLPKPAEVFCVGGAVRDALLGVRSTDRDYVVVGCTVNAMLDAGFTPVGRDFPVFLHPISKDEYALARTERKSGRGYKGFSFNASPEVTLTEDLSRRDLTINAMAIGAQGELIDPFHGLDDLRCKILRHIGPAFSEDPVRLLRLARFSARWPEFTVAPETMLLAQKIVDDGEANALVAERVWQELQTGLMENKPSNMIEILCACGAWKAITGRPSPDALTLSALDRCAQSQASLELRYAVLLAKDHDGLHGAFKPPKPCADMARLLYHSRARLNRLQSLDEDAKDNSLDDFLSWLEQLDGFRRPDRVKDMLQGHHALTELLPETIARIRSVIDRLTQPEVQQVISQAAQDAQQSGLDVSASVRAARLSALKAVING